MTEDESNTPVSDVFGDTCVLFNYAVECQEPARRLFKERSNIEKVVSPRIKREFESVSGRQQDIHRELLKFATSGEIGEYDPEVVGSHSNDLRYVIDLYSELVELDDTVEVVRRLNELVNRLEKAEEELFGQDGLVLVINVDGLDAQLKGLLSGVVDNNADVRILCDAVAWRRNGGSGTFLSEDTEDILGKGDVQPSDESVDEDDLSESGEGLPDSFEDFLSEGKKKPLPERINEKITIRYDSSASLRIMSVSEFLNKCLSTSDQL